MGKFRENPKIWENLGKIPTSCGLSPLSLLEYLFFEGFFRIPTFYHHFLASFCGYILFAEQFFLASKAMDGTV